MIFCVMSCKYYKAYLYFLWAFVLQAVTFTDLNFSVVHDYREVVWYINKTAKANTTVLRYE